MTRFPGSNIETSRIGFGCAFLVGGASAGESARLVDAAFDAGIRHFDVAPSYGLGLAEDVVGATLSRRRHRITITTKVGVPRPRWGYQLSVVRSTVRPLLQRVGRLRETSARIGGALASGREKLDRVILRRGLEESLRRLRTDYVDALLLHERAPHEVGAEIVESLEGFVDSGQIGSYGIGIVGPGNNDLFERPIGRIVQFASSIFSQPYAAGCGQMVITHRAIMNGRLKLARELADDAALRGQVSELVDFDPVEEEHLADLLLAAAFQENPSGIVLVSSRKVERIARYAQIPFNSGLMEAGRRIATHFGATSQSTSRALNNSEAVEKPRGPRSRFKDSATG
ncbi:aldo/keto reductase [Methylocystis echinoides]|uniref:aldo/keto reductase n=1 Tax=Methylocystis echinoides TaxID=29468 RepID=UPI0034134EA7